MLRVMFPALLLAAAAAAQTFPYDHIHVNVPDPAAAANWYEKYFGGRRITEAPDRLMFGSTRFMFLRNAADSARSLKGASMRSNTAPRASVTCGSWFSAAIRSPAKDTPSTTSAGG